MSTRDPVNSPTSADRWTEDLVWEAKRGVELGRTLCTCPSSYHALWGALRAAGFLGSLWSEESTLASVISPLMAGQTRMLIGGSADPATLCAVGRASRSSDLEITVVDRCEAPLELIKEFSANKGISCRTIQADILEFDRAQQWDIVLLNYTLSFIVAPSRKIFFERLANCLTIGGTLVCLAKTGNPATDAQREELESTWFHQARKALEMSQFKHLWESAELDDILHRYAAARTARRFNIISADEIQELLRDVGLTPSMERATPRKWTPDGVAVPKSDVESSVIVTAIRPR